MNVTNQSSSITSSGQPQGDLRSRAANALSKAGDTAKEAVDGAKESASALASDANKQVQGLLNRQVGHGAEVIGHLTSTARLAADDLDRTVPQLAGVVRGAAQKMEDFSTSIRGQSFEQLARHATDFARERPVIVFGAAAACGFMLLRVFIAGAASTPAHVRMRSPSDMPTYGQSHGDA
jgi:ElaB/YqjD/DUF883 family membrane-anchored ribosome-binding protein